MISSSGDSRTAMRPRHIQPCTFRDALRQLPAGLPAVRIGTVSAAEHPAASVALTGVCLDSRQIQPGDLYIAAPGARTHGAEFASAALRHGAAAILTDATGAGMIASQPAPFGVPVFVCADVRELTGPLAAAIFSSQPAAEPRPKLFGVTGTNGKTTTSYFVASLLQALGQTTGLIGTIEILAGAESIPSALTTPEAPQVHSLLALMRERTLDATAMEVSSHALEFGRVDGVWFDVAGFTNLTQDHLDLHGTMEAYRDAKGKLFRRSRCGIAVVCIDDTWGEQMAAAATCPVITLRTDGARTDADWHVSELEPDGSGHRFILTGSAGQTLSLRTGLPGTFNVANAALAAVMVLASGVDCASLQAAADLHDPFTTAVPGRMQLIGEHPRAIVDFAHNTDALSRTLTSLRATSANSRLIVVFGATGQRDETKRPIMGATAAQLADVVIVTDDDPHDEDPGSIRRAVLAGALEARANQHLACEILEVAPRAVAIERAVALASPLDTIVVAGRGHEIWQEIKGVNVPLDDRVELAAALTRHGFSVLADWKIES